VVVTGAATALAQLAPELLAADLEPMLARQRVIAVVLAAIVAGVVFELVRRRKLREEYSWVWMGTSVVVVALALNQGLLLTISEWIGSSSTVSTLFFGALLFLLALVLQFSVRLSRLTHRHRTLGQRLALLEAEVVRLRAREAEARDAAPAAAQSQQQQPQQHDVVA
jgi:hypothetical protein